jgi:hypothetical protein
MYHIKIGKILNICFIFFVFHFIFYIIFQNKKVYFLKYFSINSAIDDRTRKKFIDHLVIEKKINYVENL